MTVNLWYGGDYNPEQWTREVWSEDAQLMTRAGVTVVTVGVFSWAELEPRNGEFEFEWLDDVLNGLHAVGIRVDLATATASPPAWMSHDHPEILPRTVDGVTLWPGSRQHYSASSPVYRRYAGRLVRMLAERYGKHPALAAWHVGNEFANDNPRDYGDAAAQAFRTWLQGKYGNIQALNAAWGTSFWSQRYNTFDEVLPPRSTPSFGNPAHLLDFDRFSSDEHLACFLAEVEILKEISPGVPITTNFMGFFKSLDYWKWAQHVDFVSDDSYPDPADPQSYIEAAMARDLMRSLGDGAPWILMEQSTSAVNWRSMNAAKPPGLMRALSLQALARGADGVMFFQWRQSIAGAEKFHSAMLPAQGPEHRIHQEVRALGAELKTLAAVAGSRVEPARVAIVFDWQSWWSIEQTALPTTINYIEGIRTWYRDLYRRGVLVDFAKPGDHLGAYELVIVPSLFVTSTETLTTLGDYAGEGGKLLVTYLTGITDEDTRFVGGGFLGSLSTVLGVRIEEFAPHDTGFAEVLTITGADVFAEHEEGPLLGEPLVTHRSHRAGEAWYVAGDLNDSQRDQLLKQLLPGAETDATGRDGVEIVRRGELTFAMNFTETTALVPMGGDRLIGPEEQGGFVRLERYDSAVWRAVGQGTPITTED